MTDTTKRLAEDKVAFIHERISANNGYTIGALREALADFDRTADQEANVRGNAPQFRAARSDDGPDDWTCELRYGNVLLLIDLDKDDAGVAIMRNGKFQAALPDAAPHPTPAPASEEVTDILTQLRDETYWEDNIDAALARQLADDLEYALAATRARKGERKKTCTHCNGAGCPYCHGEGDVYVPNAADAEAYRVVTLEDAKTIREKWDDVFYLSDAATTDEAMLAALQSIGAVIPTAAPVPADEGEKK